MVSFTGASGLLAGGSYLVESSRDNFVTTSRASTPRTSAVLSTQTASLDGILAVRVRAVQLCGTQGAPSSTLSISLLAAPAEFVVTRGGVALQATVGSPAPSGVVHVRNVGGRTGRLTLTAVSNRAFFEPSSPAVDVPAGAEAVVTVRALGGVMGSVNLYFGLLRASYDGGAVSATVALAVTENPPPPPAKVRASANLLYFSAPSGQDPPAQTIVLTLDPPSTPIDAILPIREPGGQWVELTYSSPTGGSPLLVEVRVNRSRRSADDGVPPLKTLLRFLPAFSDPESDSAVVEVVDAERGVSQAFGVTLFDTGSGAGLRGTGTERRASLLVVPPPGGTSFVLPTSVKAAGVGGQTFTSDGWLRNLSAGKVSAQLFYTPEGADGLTDSRVRVSNVEVPGGATYRLSELLRSAFGTTESTSGQVELRTASPYALSFRSTVDSLPGGGDPTGRFGTEIPAVPYASGAAAGGQELVIPGISESALSRANLILAETGAGPARAMVTVYDGDGRSVGSLTRDVPIYGKLQVNQLVNEVAGNRLLESGWAGVKVLSGTGRLTALATVIDNRSGSFSAYLARAVRGTSAARFLLPTTVRTRGAFDTLFTTALYLTNGTATAARLDLSYSYVDQDDGNLRKSARRTVTVPARSTLPAAFSEDTIATVFGVTNRSYGSISLEGEVGKVVAWAEVRAQVDPEDASKGLKKSPVPGVFLDAPSVQGTGQPELRFSGAEKSVQKRTNLILLEVDGAACQVRVRASTPRGARLAERTFDVGPGQYLQVNDVFGSEGLDAGSGPFQNVELTAQVVAGSGRVVAVATVNDNISRNPEIFAFQETGPSSTEF